MLKRHFLRSIKSTSNYGLSKKINSVSGDILTQSTSANPKTNSFQMSTSSKDYRKNMQLYFSLTRNIMNISILILGYWLWFVTGMMSYNPSSKWCFGHGAGTCVIVSLPPELPVSCSECHPPLRSANGAAEWCHCWATNWLDTPGVTPLFHNHAIYGCTLLYELSNRGLQVTDHTQTQRYQQKEFRLLLGFRLTTYQTSL